MSCSKNQHNISSKSSNSSTNVKNYSSVHTQTSSVPTNSIEDDFDDFDPRGTSTTSKYCATIFCISADDFILLCYIYVYTDGALSRKSILVQIFVDYISGSYNPPSILSLEVNISSSLFFQMCCYCIGSKVTVPSLSWNLDGFKFFYMLKNYGCILKQLV